MSKFYYLKKVEDHKYGFVYTKEFETDGVLNDIEITRCVDFANRMVWGEGYHRGKRSGGIKERSEKEKFVNTLQGKITECALHKYLQGYHLDTSGVDFSVFGKARLSKYGIVIYERYVDDMLVVTNKYISQEMFWEVINETIKEVFGKSPVKINMSPSKFSYIPRREITDVKKMFNFLGYEFQIKRVGNDIEYSYGIAEKKRRRYSGIFERAFIEYKRTGDLELLRQRIKLFASRVVIAKKISSKNYDWLTKGIIANYNELQYHMNRLIPSTEEFLKTQFVKLTTQYFSTLPYFMKESMRGESIYNLYSNMKRNRSIVFEKNIGVSEKTLLKWINQIKPDYNKGNKDYYRIVMDYIEMLKVEQHHF